MLSLRMPNSVPTHFNFSQDVFEHWALERPDALALWCVSDEGNSGCKLTFSELANKLRRAASFFHQIGLKKGDRVLVITRRVPEWWIAMLGLIRLGAIPIPGTPLLTAHDIRYRVQTSEAAAILTDSEGADKADSLQTLFKICTDGERAGWINFTKGIGDATPEFEPEPTSSKDPGLIYFTSGTTGPPKMVLHTQSSYGLGHRITGELWLDLRPSDIHWCLTDTGWAKAAWSCFFGPWQMGACVFATDSRSKFDPSAALRTLAQYPITTWCAPPTALRAIVREDLSAYRFPQLRHCVSAGEPLNPEVFLAWKAATGLSIHDGYGQTESVLLIGNFPSHKEEIRPGSMGKPSPGFTIGLLDDQLQEVPPGNEGEIAVRVKPERPLGLFQEYWRNPTENLARFQGDWYLTGDRAWCDEEGYFWFVGRGDDVIKSSGYRIGPFEVESALIEHPAVVEAAVIGKPDEARGMLVKAFVVLRKEHAKTEDLCRELQEHCKRVTAPYKYPREIEFVDELPKTISGKIRRVELRSRRSR
jgi:acyl-coenzyme A synthetase/AMP-(fatty) acid ligase